MGNRGVLLYVDLGKLEDEPYRLSKIYDTLGQYIDDIRRQRDIIYISKMAESLDISSLDRYRAQLTDEYERLGTLKKILDEAYDLYKECNEKFEASGQTLCNLYAETPWYETSEGKLAIGIGVLVVTAAVAIVCPAVLGAAAATVTQSIATSAIIGAATSGVMNGIASMNSGNSFYDGFASGFESGAILGAISGGLGAGTSAIMSGAELTVGRVMAVKAMNMVSDATVDSVVYAYHSNKYDKDFSGGDIVKTWVKSAATSFAMQSVGGGKSSSKTDGGNGVISTGKGRGEPEGSFKCKSGRESSIKDYSNRFADSLVDDFNTDVEVRDVVKEDMILVQFSSDAPNASLRYWTTIDEANGISTIEEYMDKMALSKEWGNRNVVKVARVKKKTEVTHAIGTAKAQTKISDPRPGNGKQILFSKFDSNWITEVRNIKE